MNPTPEQVERFAALFPSGSPNHYVADFKRAEREKGGKLVPDYTACKGAPTLKEYERHLRGEMGLLAVPVDAKGFSEWGVIDVDKYDVDGPAVVQKISELYLPLIVCKSKSGGLHLIYHGPRIKASELRARLERWARMLGFAGCEIFPKQDQLASEATGNGINLPYFGESGNVLINAKGEGAPFEHFLDTTERLREVTAGAPDDDVIPKEAVEALSRHWSDGTRNKIAYPLCGFLMRHNKNKAYCDTLLEAVIAQTGVGMGSAKGVSARVERDLAKDKPVQGYPWLCKQIGIADAAALAAAVGIVLTSTQLEEPESWPLSLVHSATEFIQLPIPPREPVIEGLLLTESLVEVFAKRGAGKTFFAMELAVAIARGTGTFFKWPVHKARGVLFIDGEMSGAELQQRARMFPGVETLQNLHFIASHSFYQTYQAAMNLADPGQQQCLRTLLDAMEAEGRKVEVLVLDNKSALTRGTVENATEGQEGLVNFLTGLRHRGLTVILIHHAGKSGDQRGASSLEDPFDLVIKLEEPKPDKDTPPSTAEGAEFIISFTKHRNLKKPQPYLLRVELMVDMDGRYTWGMTEPASKRGKSKLVRTLEYLYDHPGTSKQAEIARALGVDPSDMSKVIKEARAGHGKGPFLEEGGLELTDSARLYVERVRECEDAGQPDADGGASF